MLDKAYREIQSQVHPDRFATSLRQFVEHCTGGTRT